MWLPCLARFLPISCHHVLFGYPPAIVLKRYMYRVIHWLCCNKQLPLSACQFHLCLGIRNQAKKYLLQLSGVSRGDGQVGGKIGVDLYIACVEVVCFHFEDTVNEVINVDMSLLRLGVAGKGGQPSHDAGYPLGAFIDKLKVLPRILRDVFSLQQKLSITDDACPWIIYLMGDTRCQLTD